MVIGAFAGVRHAELQRLEWTDLLLDRGYVVVRATQSKTGSRRLVPIQENLRIWLSRMQPGEREVCEVANMASAIALLVREINRGRRAVWAQANQVSEDQLKETMKEARKDLAAAKAARSKQAHKNSLPPGAETSDTEGWTPFVWKQNALRHSFISYRLAENPNMAEVSLESGTSPQMVHRHYKALVNVAEAKEWFSITPEVVDLRKLQLMKIPARYNLHPGSRQSGLSCLALLTSLETRWQAMSSAGYGRNSVFKNCGSKRSGCSHH